MGVERKQWNESIDATERSLKPSEKALNDSQEALNPPAIALNPHTIPLYKPEQALNTGTEQTPPSF